MVAIVNSGTSIRKSFFYNDNKLERGDAVLLMAENYPMNLEHMNQQQRLAMLLKTAGKAPEIKRPSLHISLNFAPGEQLSDALLRQLSTEYMERIGLGSQPFLMYRHHDAAHPHVHIVTHRVDPGGHPIDTFRIGQRRSEPARKALEIKYGLVRAEDHCQGLFLMPPVHISKAVYSKSETKKAIEDRVNYVLHKYRFKSLSEMNAVLKGYNIYADRGAEGSRCYKNNGLVYRLLDGNGCPAGIPIRSSSMTVKATLKDITAAFKQKTDYSASERARIKNAVDLALKKSPPPGLTRLAALLLEQHIRMVLYTSKARGVYGIAYVDSKNRCVFNGNDLGPAYSANAIRRRCKQDTASQLSKPLSLPESPKRPAPPAPRHPASPGSLPSELLLEPWYGLPVPLEPDPGKDLLELLMAPEYVYEPLPYALRPKKKKKKK